MIVIDADQLAVLEFLSTHAAGVCLPLQNLMEPFLSEAVRSDTVRATPTPPDFGRFWFCTSLPSTLHSLVLHRLG